MEAGVRRASEASVAGCGHETPASRQQLRYFVADHGEREFEAVPVVVVHVTRRSEIFLKCQLPA